MCAFNVSCAVCKEPFKTSDAVYSTSCGHIFHFFCMNQWRAKSTSCPLCRTYNPTSHLIYLHFDDHPENSKVLEDMKAKLKSLEAKCEKIKVERDKRDQKIDDVKRLYNISEQWRAELQDKLRVCEREKETQNGIHSKELESKEAEIGLLKTCIQNMENGKGAEVMCGKINEFSVENLKLKKGMKEKEAAEVILRHKLEILEQRLKHLTLELQNQIAFNLSTGKENIPQRPQTQRLKKPHTDDTTTNQPEEQATLKVGHPNDYKVVITGIRSKDLVYPLTETVKLLATKMATSLADEDIRNVSLVSNKSSNCSNKIVLSVEFNSLEKRNTFITHKNRLKSHAETNLVNIKEFIDDITYPVFMYANNMLRHRGYGYIICKGNKVIAKRNRNDKEEVVIENRSDVDQLMMARTQPLHSFRSNATGVDLSIWGL